MAMRLSSNRNHQRLVVFVLLLALSNYFQIAASFWWVTMPSGMLYALAGIGMCFFSGSIVVLCCTALLSWVHLMWFVPSLYNNFVLGNLIYLSIALACGWFFIRQKELGLKSGDVYAVLAPVVRCYVVMMYVFTCVAKCNEGFIDPQNSCVSFMVDHLKNGYAFPFSFIFSLPAIKPIAIGLTLAAEFSIPVLLFFRRSRHVGIIVGLVFHFLIGLSTFDYVFGFSIMMLPLFFTFLSDEAFDNMHVMLTKIKHRVNVLAPHRSIRFGVLIAAVFLTLGANAFVFHHAFMTQKIWFIIYPCVAIIMILAIHRCKKLGHIPTKLWVVFRQDFLPRSFILIMMLIPVIFNGLGPYLGYKTSGSLGMFSNLRIREPYGNHLFIPESTQIFKPDLVRVLHTNNDTFQKFKHHHLLVTAFEFRRLAHNIKQDFDVQVIYKGRVISLQKINGVYMQHPLFKPLPWLSAKFIYFQSVPDYPGNNCFNMDSY